MAKHNSSVRHLKRIDPVLEELRHQACRWVDRDLQQGRLKLLERVGTGGDGDDTPRPRTEGGEEAGADDGGLAATTRPDNREEACVLNAFEEPCRQRLAAEEVVGVGLEERPEALVGIAYRRFGAALARLAPIALTRGRS